MRPPVHISCFNTQPHGGGCSCSLSFLIKSFNVSTHSRTEAAASPSKQEFLLILLFQHTAARRRLLVTTIKFKATFLFQHTAARRRLRTCFGFRSENWRGFNTQPHGGGCQVSFDRKFSLGEFQHTAARRRLLVVNVRSPINTSVSTHSRTEAAA